MERNLKKIKYWICDLVILLWFLSMVGTTWLTRNLYAQMLKDAMVWSTDALITGSGLERYCDGINVSGLPGEAENGMLEIMSSLSSRQVDLNLFGDERNIMVGTCVVPEVGIAFYDSEGNLLLPGGKYMKFQYFTEESWKAGKNTIDGWGMVPLRVNRWDFGKDIARKLLNEMLFDEVFAEKGTVDLMRLTGKWDGTEYIPENFNYIVDAGDGNWQQRDSKGLLNWKYVNMPEDAEAIYLTWPRLIECSSELTYDLVNVVEGNIAEPGDTGTISHIAGGIGLLNQDTLDRVVVCDAVGFPGSETGSFTGESEIIMLTMMEAHPLQAAMRSLLPVYIVSFLAIGAALWILIRMMNSRVLDVVESQLQNDKTEITRLNKALDYAHRAEENRRALVSGVAHELKTPLAVIHGYAEGLKERIAEDKRDKYLDTILSETQRMDGLVLQMLDLSRLEAGKVKLARDEFDLCELIREVFGKLELLSIQKNLELSFEMPESLAVRADRSRMEQVITNFASNAVRYTQPGGWIKVRVIDGEDGWGMTVENKSRPFSPEQLEGVFDSFYRIDESRTGKGTGLGLAIARSVVELHGGKCHVRNTGPGVEFGFSVSVK